jgi:peptidyl-prolyl cis-trans isomerase B (cyclophilin B)
MKSFSQIHKGSLFLIIMVLFTIIVAGCGTTSEKDPAEGSTEKSAYPKDIKENPIVTMTMENNKEITIELYPDVAPNTVANFVSLIEDKFYDGLIFHRVIPEFMIQGGDPSGNGTGGPDYAIKGEFSSNGFDNTLKHDRGVLSMARSQSPDSAGSQFFIMVANSPHLDGEYAGFGKVTDGMDVVDDIVSVDTNDADKPLKDQKIKEVTVDTKGYDYPKPEVK